MQFAGSICVYLLTLHGNRQLHGGKRSSRVTFQARRGLVRGICRARSAEGNFDRGLILNCMFRNALLQGVLPIALPAAGLFCLVLPPQAAYAWGNEGHRMINRLAAQSLPVDVPAFLRSQAAVDEIEYLGPEPDRWRSRAEPELEAAQAPEHFIDLEAADAIGPFPHKRLDWEAMVFAAGKRPEVIGQYAS